MDHARNAPNGQPNAAGDDLSRISGEYRNTGGTQHSVYLPGTTNYELSSTYSSTYKFSRNRRNTRTDEGNKGRNLSAQRNKNNDLSRKIRKKFILICPPNLLKTTIDIRTPFNRDIGNFVLVMNPTLRNNEDPFVENLRNNQMIVPP
ncbi:MAG: hypothetical protein Q8811_01500, partial [Candidatus Phytoplasma australasiaticum]|nr:hypothetical protein [Candidatus Phytoplasma australasiaticum]